MVSATSYLNASYFIAPLYDPHHLLPFRLVGGLGDDFLLTWLHCVFIIDI